MLPAYAAQAVWGLNLYMGRGAQPFKVS